MARSGTADAGAEHLVLERYRLLRRLGAGGFGTVWLARDERLEREVAVKLVPRSRLSAARPAHEARAAARLSHPGIVALYEAGEDEAGAYLVSELVRGPTLARLMRDGALSDRDVARIGVALCDALGHAHLHGVVHRDVKPSNVLVPEAPVDRSGVAKLTDFGVARIAGAEALTRTGDIVGTLAYMAPEQAAGRPVDARADLYALALVLYEALCGTNPVRANGPAATARRVGRPLPPLSRARRDLSGELCDALDRALRPAPAQRGTVDDLRGALAAALPGLDDEPGAIEPQWSRREARGWAYDDEAEDRRPSDRWDEDTSEWPAPRERRRFGRPAASGAPGGLAERRRMGRAPAALEVRPPWRWRWHERLTAGVGAAALAAALVALLRDLVPVTPAAIPLAAGLVAALPRAGWLAATTATAGYLAAKGHREEALTLAAAFAPVPLLLAHAAHAWSLPVAGPLLGAAQLSGAAPALATVTRSLYGRAVLGGLAAWWAILALRLGHHGHIPGVQALPLIPIWAAAAALLPVLVRGQGAGLDLVGALTWAGATTAATAALVHPAPAGALAGSALAAALLAARALVRAASRPTADPAPLA